jgi:hypothetical protein
MVGGLPNFVTLLETVFSRLNVDGSLLQPDTYPIGTVSKAKRHG